MLSGNRAQYGAGLYVDAGSSAALSEAIFLQNSAFSAGGGLYIDTTGDLNLDFSAVIFNHAPAGEGGGIYNAGSVVLGSSTVRFNTVSNCSPALSVRGCTG